MRIPAWLLAAAVGGWVGGTAFAFWTYALADRQPFTTADQLATFDADARAASAEAWFRARGPSPNGRAATVVALHATGCACDRYARAHVARIERAYAVRNVAVLHVAADGAPVDVAPSALVFDAEGRLAYYGPYSDEALCGAGRTGFVERALDAVLDGRRPALVPMLATGCVCRRGEPRATARAHDPATRSTT